MEHLNVRKRNGWDMIKMSQFLDRCSEDEKMLVNKIINPLDDFEYVKTIVKKIEGDEKRNDLFCIACCFASDPWIIDLMYKEYKNDIETEIQWIIEGKGIGLMSLVCYINDCVEIIKYLVENMNLDITKCDDDGNHCLHIASQNNSLDVIKYLISRGLDPKSQNNEGIDCLMKACFSTVDVSIVKYYIEDIKMSPFSVNIFGQTSLLLACQCQKNNIQIIKYLIEKCGMDLFSKDLEGYDCLTWACYFGFNRIDVIKYLIDVMGSGKIRSMHSSNKKKYSYLISACKINHDIDVIKYLIEDIGLDTLYTDLDGNNCLLAAATTNPNPMILQYLIEEVGMDVNVKTYDGSNIFRICCRNNNLRVIKYLIEKVGADVHYVDPGGDNCLLDVSTHQNVDVVKYIVEDLKFDIGYENEIGIDCLLAACAANPNIDTIKYMINDLKMDVEKVNIDGSNCLTLSLHLNENLDVVRYLIESTDVPVKLFGLEISRYVAILRILHKNPRRINEFVKRGIRLYGNKCLFEKNKNGKLKGIVNPLIFDNDMRLLLHINPFKFKYKTFVRFADALKCRLKLEDTMIYEKHYALEDMQTSDIEDDECVGELNDLLFYCNDIPYYGIRQKVFESMLLFNDTEYLSHCEPVKLSVDIPEYVMNLYVESCHNGLFSIDKIKTEDFVRFLNLIDQYPTKRLSIENMEIELICYMDINNMMNDEKVKHILMKYHLKRIYLYLTDKLEHIFVL
jgi:ankyrin repeat protein